ncbi:phosphate acyltransferase, partial [Acinetobacter baumannii]|nr:phosphate acyltransferase [Acinetobacter baumannii]
VDAGANSECKPNNLLEFAMMGSIYMDKVIGRTNPKVGLVNLGVEENKGSTLTKAAYELLDKSHMNFVGNVEAREVPRGACDVIVCDGFVGNVILKLTEGLALNIMELLKSKFTDGMKAKIG